MRTSWFAAAAAVMVLSGCGDDDVSSAGGDDPDVAFDRDAGFVGELDGTDAFVAVVVDDDTAEVYACDGASGIAARFTGEVEDPESFTLTDDAGGEASVEFADGAYSGELTLADGSTHAFGTEAAVGDAGLFHLVDPPEGVSAGWVVLNDGSQRGSFGVSGSNLQVVEAPPIQGTSGRIAPPQGVAQVGLNFRRAQP